MLVSDRMRRDLVTVTEQATLAQAAALLATRGIRHLPVVAADGRLVGIVTDRDLRSAAPSTLAGLSDEAIARLMRETTVGAVMVREVVTVPPAVPLEEAARLLTTRRIGSLPVVEGDHLIGIITETDILRQIVKDDAFCRDVGSVMMSTP